MAHPSAGEFLSPPLGGERNCQKRFDQAAQVTKLLHGWQYLFRREIADKEFDREYIQVKTSGNPPIVKYHPEVLMPSDRKIGLTRLIHIKICFDDINVLLP
jgi:hypothetical protein